MSTKFVRERESKERGSQVILPPNNTHCKASVLSFGDIQPDLEYAASAIVASMAVSQTNSLLATWRRAVRCAAGSGYHDNVAPLVKQ